MVTPIIKTMSEKKYVRFRQRREHFNDAFQFLNEAIRTPSPERIREAAITKAFELCFELAWKTLKDLVEYQGVTVLSPRDVLKEAFVQKLLDDGQAWIDMLDERNLLVHIYQKAQAVAAVEKITKKYLPLLDTLSRLLNSR